MRRDRDAEKQRLSNVQSTDSGDAREKMTQQKEKKTKKSKLICTAQHALQLAMCMCWSNYSAGDSYRFLSSFSIDITNDHFYFKPTNIEKRDMIALVFESDF